MLIGKIYEIKFIIVIINIFDNFLTFEKYFTVHS